MAILYHPHKISLNNSKNIFWLLNQKMQNWISRYNVVIQKNLMTFCSWVIVGIRIQIHKEKKIIDEKKNSPHFKPQRANIYFYAWFTTFDLHYTFYERISQFSTMKRIETSPEEAEVNIDYLRCLNINW